MATGNVRKIILLFCSDSLVLSVLRDALEVAGYLVMSAEDLGTAVNRLKECKADLLIVSPYVDSLTGYDAAIYLRTKCHGLPVLVVAGYLDDERLRDRASIASFELFPSPFTRADFLAKVQSIVNPPSAG